MDAQQLQDRLRIVLGWRVGPHTAQYVLARLTSSKGKAIKVFANDARTGLPLYQTLNPAQIAEAAQPTLF